MANDLLNQLRLKKEIDLIIISKQYQEIDSPVWFLDILGTAASWIPTTKKVLVDYYGYDKGFVWAKSKDIPYISCYHTPNESISQFQEKLDLLEDTIRKEEGKVLMAGMLKA